VEIASVERGAGLRICRACLVTFKTDPEAPASSLSPPALALYVVYPPELAGQVIDLVPGLSLGRAPPEESPGEAEAKPFAVLAHATVSRRHCELAREIIVPVLSDLQSRNGTKLDGVPVTTRKALLPQSVVRIGSVLGVVDERPRVGPAPTATLPGSAPATQRAREALERAAASTAPVIILGDTGTGKERVAAELHRRSGRAGPYVKFSCAELSRELVESQLFGHERGAFTGASSAHAGLFVAADRGTLFLDEVGELPLDLQAKLLRVLQEGEVRPLGSLATRRVDVRVVGATNRDLRAEVERGSFRRDLYARLSFFEVALPPLRARRQDLLPWMQILCAHFSSTTGAPIAELRLQPDVAELLLLHAWPENLRGLDRFVHRVRSSGETSVGRRVLAQVMPELGAEPSVPAPPDLPAAEGSQPPAFERPSREEFLGVYEATGRNVRATSKHFGRDRRQIYRWLELFEIER
jgi:DNA-binding NtrC family response regulator